MAKVELPLEQIDALRNGFNAFVINRESLSIGDIVVQKEVLDGIFRFPTKEQPGIVIEFLPNPKRGHEIDPDTLGSPHGSALFDVIIGSYDNDGDWRLSTVDSRLLTKVS